MVCWLRAIQAACLFRGRGIWILKEKYKEDGEALQKLFCNVSFLKKPNLFLRRGLFISGAPIVNDVINFCFRLLQEPYMETSVRPKTKFLMLFTIKEDRG